MADCLDHSHGRRADVGRYQWMPAPTDQDDQCIVRKHGMKRSAKTKRWRRGGTKATSHAIARLFYADPAKALVMKRVGRFVTDGYAEWDVLDNGDIQLRFNTGETFLLAETVIVRLA
jgi:hypothetical protein